MVAERAVDFGEIGTENDLVNFLSVHSTNPYSTDGWAMHNKPGGVYHQGDEKNLFTILIFTMSGLMRYRSK